MAAEGLQPGDEIAGYRVERDLGAGGMGMVYLVLQPSLGKRFALKLLPSFLSREPEFMGRFEREMRTVSRLDHPNIVATTNAGTSDGRVWYTMTYVRGIDAAEAIRKAPDGLSPDRVTGIVDAIADALDFAHRHGVAHRDVKPGNVLLGDDGRVFLTDFGIAKVVGETSTVTTFQPFTADFASPEQVGNEAVGTRTDVYSLGATCHALLTGQVPFPGDYTAKIYGHRHLPPPQPSALRRDLPPGVDRVIATAMAKNPAGRYATCGQFADALRQSLAAAAATRLGPGPDVGPGTGSGPPASRPADPIRSTLPAQPPRSTSPHSWKSANRGQRWMVVAAAVVVLVGGGYAVQASLGGRVGGTAAAPDAAVPGTTVTSRSSTGAADGGAVPSREPTGGSAPPATTASAVPPASAAVALSGLLDPAPTTASGTSGDVPVTGAAIRLGPSNCTNGSQRYTVDGGSGLRRITGSFLMSDDAAPNTRTQVTVTADDSTVAQETVAPGAGATIDVDVRGAESVEIDLASAGSGICGTEDYLVFLTNAVAYR